MWKILEVSTEDKLNTLDDTIANNNESTTIQQRVSAVISVTPDNASHTATICSTNDTVIIQHKYDKCKPIREYTFNYDHLDNIQMDYSLSEFKCCGADDKVATNRKCIHKKNDNIINKKKGYNMTTELPIQDLIPNNLILETKLQSSINNLNSAHFAKSILENENIFLQQKKHKFLTISRLADDGSLVNAKCVSYSDTQINNCNKWFLNSKLESKHRSYSIEIFNDLICQSSSNAYQYSRHSSNYKHYYLQSRRSLSNPNLDELQSFS